MPPIDRLRTHCPMLVALVLVLLLSRCAAPTPPSDYFGVPVAEVEAELDTLLHIWYPRIVDTVNGGYWTNFEYDWTPSAEQPKMLVTQARGLWTAARAAGVFPDSAVYWQAADHGYVFLTQSMWDTVRGGFYLNFPVPAQAEVEYKLTYGNAFALYALAEYARINPDPAVLAWVKKAFGWLESAAHDPVEGGYFNVILADTTALTDPARQPAVARIGWGSPKWKDQNSSIHILEALTTTYQVWPDEVVQQRLEEMLRLVRDTMVNADGYLHLYFTHDWAPIRYRDSSRAFILDHLAIDHNSFGHDIETAYLLLDAAQALYGAPDSLTLRVAKRLVDHTLAYGFDRNYYGLFDRGYPFPGTDTIEIVDRRKTWWAQAEAWHALGLYARMYPQEPVYAEAFRQMWAYIGREMIDRQYGEWYNQGLDTYPENRTARKAHPWKGAYHNGRALIQVREYATNTRK